MPQKITIEEKFVGGIKHALMHNFSRYSEALLELVDNAVSDRIEGKTIKVDILSGKDIIKITNFGGRGMMLKELREFLEWGKIKERRAIDIGAYSQGGKSAMGYLGNKMKIISSPKDKKIEYRFNDDDLHDYKTKKYEVDQLETERKEGYVCIEIGALSHAIKDDEIKKILCNTYRPLIQSGAIIIYYNGETLNVEKFPIEKKLQEVDFKVNNYTKGFDRVHGWVGLLTPRSGVKGGIRCYKLGRLISEHEYFDLPDPSYKQTLNLLFGEVSLDHVPATTNKTNFDHGSVEWKEVKEEMKKILQPYIDELLGREIEEPTEEEKDRVKEVKKIFAELLKLRDKQIKGTLNLADYSYGQKRPEKLGLSEKNDSIATNNKKQPKTPPPVNSIGKRKRLKEFLDWDVRPMDESIRSIIEDKGAGRKMLVINNLYPGYRTFKYNEVYLIETATLQLALPEKDEKISPVEYLKEFDDLFAFFCTNINKVKEVLKEKKKMKKSI